MANRKLSAEHKKRISESMKKHHNSIKKGVATGQFGAQTSEYDMTVQGIRTLSKSLGIDQAYQLSIDIRSAITAISNNIGKMKIRLYNARSGKEVIAGDLFKLFKKPSPRYTSSRWLSELTSFLALYNEIALLRDPRTTAPSFLMPLSPGRLHIQDPTIVRDVSQIRQWRYSWEDGLIAYYTNDQVCFDKLFNPKSNVRGVSPILTGVNEISSSYEAIRYNKQYFENNAVPSHMLVLPEGTPRQQRLDIENRYLSTFGIHDGNAHKVMVVSGGDVDIKNLDMRPKDAEFTQLISMNTMRIAQLYKVPAIEMGIYDKTRFETADTEREMFLENTLIPIAERISDFLQDQVVDRWFSNSKVDTASYDAHMSKTLKNTLDKAMQRANSDIVVIIDYEQTPIAAKVLRQKVAAIAELRKSAGLSYNEAAEYMGLELPEPKESPDNFRDMVFINSGETRIDNMLNVAQPIIEEPKPIIEETEVEEIEVDNTEEVEDIEEEVKQVKSFLRKYRKLAIVAADSGEIYRLSEIDKIIESEIGSNEFLHILTRSEYAIFKKLIENKNVRAIKDAFNTKNRQWIKSFAKSIAQIKDSK